MARIRRACSSPRKRQRVGHGVGDVIDVVRVDHDRAGQLARGARKPAEEQHALLVIARRDELLRNQVHAVVQAVDVAGVGGAIETKDLLRLDVAFEQHDGPVARPRQTAR